MAILKTVCFRSIIHSVHHSVKSFNRSLIHYGN
jgi:hypothetical protein